MCWEEQASSGHNLVGRDSDDARRHKDQQLTLIILLITRAEEIPEYGHILENRHAPLEFRLASIDQSSDHRSLTITHHDAGIGLGRVEDDAALNRGLLRQIRDRSR